ncbi:MAG: D-alanyl-D-alanine carboxypeptidase [Solobacterium sp.]|nr:D-alanyl-D-alanine carboxypeptidase [Solobacterium sp.]
MRKLKYLLSLILTALLTCGAAGIPLQAEEDLSGLASTYVCLIDGDTGNILYSMQGDEQMYPASMTKVMTAIIAIEQNDDLKRTYQLLDDVYIPLTDTGASMAGFALYDSPTIEDLLYGLLIPSGAECANGLAIATSGSVEAFVDEMNRKAQEIGMYCTHFCNPHGLHEYDHYSTCHDLTLLMRYCLQNETFRRIISAKEYTSTPVLSNLQGLHMQKMLVDAIYTEVPGFIGGKTGYTPDAGRCLVSAAEVQGMNLILATGLSYYEYGPQDDAMRIYKWAQETYAIRPVVTSGRDLVSINVEDADQHDSLIRLQTEDDMEVLLNRNAVIREETEFPTELTAPLAEGTELGTYRVYADDELVYEKTYYLDHMIDQTPVAKMRDFIRNNPAVIAFYGAALIVILVFIPSFIRSHIGR